MNKVFNETKIFGIKKELLNETIETDKITQNWTNAQI